MASHHVFSTRQPSTPLRTSSIIFSSLVRGRLWACSLLFVSLLFCFHIPGFLLLPRLCLPLYDTKIPGLPFLICLDVCALHRLRIKLNHSFPSNIRVHGICPRSGGLVDTRGQPLAWLLAQYPTTNLAVLLLRFALAKQRLNSLCLLEEPLSLPYFPSGADS